jgi:gamma-glutamyl:cysteine ligase YbdK (ATP-grasp superfamily)
MRSAIHPRPVAAGVEEEFHIVDLATRRLTGQADMLMGRLPADRFSWEMQRSVLEANSRPWAGLTELAEDIAGLRQAAIAAAEPLGLGIVAAGTVPLADPGTLRPSAHLPTLELRICDSCPALEDVVLLVGLFRALVIREIAAEHDDLPLVPVRPELLEAATWRAARSGPQGYLVDPVTASPVRAGQLIGQLLIGLRPALESTGDWELVRELARSAVARGSSAARQRAARASGGLRHVVDTLIAETRAIPAMATGRQPAA